MQQSVYRVVFRGTVAPGYEVEQVKENMVRLFRVDKAQVERYFTGSPVVIKDNLDHETAVKYKEALEGAGALCSVEPVTPRPAEGPPAAPPTSPPALEKAPPGRASSPPASAPPKVSDFDEEAPGALFLVQQLELVLDWFQDFLDEAAFDTHARWLRVLGHYGLLASAGLGFVFAIVYSLKANTFVTFLAGRGWIVLLLVLQYTAVKFSKAGETLLESSPTRMGSEAFLRSYALVNLVLGILGSLALIASAIGSGNLGLFWNALIVLAACSYTASVTLNHHSLSITLSRGVSTGEEAIGVLAFFAKTFLKLVPIYFGVGILLGTLNLLFGLVNLVRGGERVFLAMGNFMTAATLTVVAAALPFLSYILYLVYYLLVDLIRSVLQRGPSEPS